MGKTISNIEYANVGNELLVSHTIRKEKNVAYTDIPYVRNSSDLGGMDCQGQMEYLLKRLGVSKNWRGSNDMFRNACSWVGTIAECKKEFGGIPKGAWLFIVEYDGGEIANGYTDGKGNASHVGVYTGIGAGVVHASSSRGCVASSTLKNGWTHVGLCKYIDYGISVADNNVVEVKVMEMQMKVFAESGSNVNMRQSPNGSLLTKVPVGEEVTAINVQGDWTKIIYNDYTGWMMSKFLTKLDGTENEQYTIYLEPATARAQKEAQEMAGV